MLQQGPCATENVVQPKSNRGLMQMVAMESARSREELAIQHPTTGQGRNVKRAVKLLKEVAYFQELERSIPGFISNASYIAEFHFVEKDMVVFRQGDPPQCMYYLISGEVGVHTHPANESRPRTPQYNKNAAKKFKNGFTRLLEDWGFKKRDRKLERKIQVDRKMEVLFTHHKTYEGFSSVAQGSSLGTQVATLGPGKCFGDAALRNDDVRNATIKCLARCEFLRVDKNFFDAKLCDKVCHFKFNVPGFANYEHQGDPKDHPATLFMDSTFNKGHVFLEEGCVGKPMILAIRRGTVAFRRRVRTKVGIRGTKGYRTWMVMGAGDVFSSLGMLGLGSVEPYSVVVTSDQCVCYVLSGRDSVDFHQVPRQILEMLLENVRERLRPVLHLSGAFCGLDNVPEGRASWSGVLGKLSLEERPMSKRTLRCMRAYACKDRSWGKHSNYQVTNDEVSSFEDDSPIGSSP